MRAIRAARNGAGANVCPRANATAAWSRGSRLSRSISAARSSSTGCAGQPCSRARSSPACVAAISPASTAFSSRSVGVCGHRNIDNGTRAPASASVYGPSRSRAYGSAPATSASTRARRRQVAQQPPTNTASRAHATHAPVTPRRRSRARQRMPSTTRRFAGRRCPRRTSLTYCSITSTDQPNRVNTVPAASSAPTAAVAPADPRRTRLRQTRATATATPPVASANARTVASFARAVLAFKNCAAYWLLRTASIASNSASSTCNGRTPPPNTRANAASTSSGA